jgi:hypothetical protein
MNGDEVLQRYDREMRARPYLPARMSATSGAGVLRVSGDYNCIVHFDLTDATADAAIEAEVSHFRTLEHEFEWKVHGHDLPSDLGTRLAKAGFEPDPQETLMVIDLAKPLPPVPAIAGCVIRRIEDPAGLEDYVAAVSAGFEDDRSHVREEFAERLNDPTCALFVAYRFGDPVAAGRLDLPPARPFGGLYSGAVARAHRGLGLYRSLVSVRLEAARLAGHEFAMVEALPTSRPILERLGFEPLTTVQGWIWRPG